MPEKRTLCIYCREYHEPSRTLSYDGKGINSCDMYRTRIATFSHVSEGGRFGDMFAASPRLLDAAKDVVENWESGDLAQAVRDLADIVEEVEVGR